MKNAMTLLALNLFSVVSLLASVFLILCDRWEWVVFFGAAVAFVHGIEKQKVDE